MHQAFEDVPVKEGGEAAMKDLLFGTLPLLEWDGVKLVERAFFEKGGGGES